MFPSILVHVAFHFSVRCIKLSLVHDMAECIVGDITPSDGVSKEDKHEMEKVNSPVLEIAQHTVEWSYYSTIVLYCVI